MSQRHEFFDGIIAGDRRVIGKAITLIESSRSDHQKQAQHLLSDIMAHTGKALRIGLTGIPGAGKSTFIEALGKMLTSNGLKVAVLAVDPSSSITGGAILGDKTRMEDLARDEMAFIRPSATGGILGGVTTHTRETMMIVEAAGYDVIIVETVGVGQSEVAVSNLVDMFILLHSPGGGDELQGIKRGIMELADLIIINKADGDFIKAANFAASECKNALHFMRPRSKSWSVPVLQASALKKEGLEDVWQKITDFKKTQTEFGEFDERRANQAVSGIWSEVHQQLLNEIKNKNSKQIAELELAVKLGKILPIFAASELLKTILKT